MLSLQSTPQGRQYYGLRNLLGSKNHQGGLHDSNHESHRKMFAVPNSLRCPVKTVQNYLINHLNPELEILFQHPREASSKFQAQKDKVWSVIRRLASLLLEIWWKQCHLQPKLFPTWPTTVFGDVGYSYIWPQCWSKAYQGSNWT